MGGILRDSLLLVSYTMLHWHALWRSERGDKTSQTEEEVGRQHQGMDRRGVRQVPASSAEQKIKMEETGCELICGAPTTAAVKE